MTLDEARAVGPGSFFRSCGPWLCLAGLRDFGGSVGWCLRGARVIWYEIGGDKVDTRTDEPEWIRIGDIEKALVGPDEVMAEHLVKWLRDGGELP